MSQENGGDSENVYGERWNEKEQWKMALAAQGARSYSMFVDGSGVTAVRDSSDDDDEDEVVDSVERWISIVAEHCGETAQRMLALCSATGYTGVQNAFQHLADVGGKGHLQFMSKMFDVTKQFEWNADLLMPALTKLTNFTVKAVTATLKEKQAAIWAADGENGDSPPNDKLFGATEWQVSRAVDTMKMRAVAVIKIQSSLKGGGRRTEPAKVACEVTMREYGLTAGSMLYHWSATGMLGKVTCLDGKNQEQSEGGMLAHSADGNPDEGFDARMARALKGLGFWPGVGIDDITFVNAIRTRFTFDVVGTDALNNERASKLDKVLGAKPVARTDLKDTDPNKVNYDTHDYAWAESDTAIDERLIDPERSLFTRLRRNQNGVLVSAYESGLSMAQYCVPFIKKLPKNTAVIAAFDKLDMSIFHTKVTPEMEATAWGHFLSKVFVGKKKEAGNSTSRRRLSIKSLASRMYFHIIAARTSDELAIQMLPPTGLSFVDVLRSLEPAPDGQQGAEMPPPVVAAEGGGNLDNVGLDKWRD